GGRINFRARPTRSRRACSREIGFASGSPILHPTAGLAFRQGLAAQFAALRIPSDLSVTAVDRVEKQRRSLQAQQDDIADRLNERGPGQPTGPRKSYKPRPVGNSRAAILRRLRREFPQIHALVLDGTLSPHRAAITAGFRRPGGPRPKQRPIDPLDLSPDQSQELWLGASYDRSVFASEEERHAAWRKHRDRLMTLWGKGGRRPLAWWCYEAGELDYPGYDFERSTLFEAGRLTE